MKATARVAPHLFKRDTPPGVHLYIVDGRNIVGDALDIDGLLRGALVGDGALRDAIMPMSFSSVALVLAETRIRRA